MKKLGLLSLGIAFFALSSFAVVKKKDIVGTWKIEQIDLSALLINISEDEKAMAEAFLPMMEEAMKSMEMTFKKKGKFAMKASMMGQEQNEEGTWTLSDDGKVLTTKSGEGPDSKMIIESLNNNKMVLNAEMDGQTIKMTFVKK